MTGAFTPGGEPQCPGCELRVGSIDEPDCLVAIDLRDEGEHMTRDCCLRQAEPDASEPCPLCGGPLPCPTCLGDLRCDQ
jgi:hypothetical protein